MCSERVVYYVGDFLKSVNFQIVKKKFLKVFSQFFKKKFTAKVFQRPKMQLSPIHTQGVGEKPRFEFSMIRLMEFHWSGT